MLEDRLQNVQINFCPHVDYLHNGIGSPPGIIAESRFFDVEVFGAIYMESRNDEINGQINAGLAIDFCGFDFMIDQIQMHITSSENCPSLEVHMIARLSPSNLETFQRNVSQTLRPDTHRISGYEDFGFAPNKREIVRKKNPTFTDPFEGLEIQ